MLSVHRLMFRGLSTTRQLSSAASSQFLITSPEVQETLHSGGAVVALESTILTHGLPPDRALKLAADAEATVRRFGAVPATVAILDGHLRVGLSQSDLERLIGAASRGNAKKVALRDLPFALNCPDKDRVFGTTVSATSFIANLAGVRVFATGGIGGVHRGAEKSMDISSDLLALQSIPVAVVSAGIKSILDIPKTLEVLESKGVTVASVGTDIFPAFFTRNSGVKSPGRADSPEEAARLFVTNSMLRPTAGMLFAVPIPESMQAMGDKIAEAIEQAHKEAEDYKILGSDVTPFMLERVRQLTGDASLEANIHLVLNNAQFAAKTALKLAEMSGTSGVGSGERNSDPQLVVIGGSNVDMAIKLKPENLKTTKDIYPPASYVGSVEVLGGGGVGRNVAEAVGRLLPAHIFLTAVSKDPAGQSLFKRHSFIAWKTAPLAKSSPQTAKYVGILNPTGELLFGVADMDIHKQVTPEFVEQELRGVVMSQVKVICSDGNIEVATLQKAISIANAHNVPFWYEPTDLHKCTKIVEATSTDHPVDAISPNLTEFQSIYEKATGRRLTVDPNNLDSLMNSVKVIRDELLGLVTNWIVKMGRHGVLLVTASEAAHFSSPVIDQKSIVSVSGAGDTSVGVMMYLRYIKQWPWQRVVIGGLRAAELSLACKTPVPETLNTKIFEDESELDVWARKIKIETLN